MMLEQAAVRWFAHNLEMGGSSMASIDELDLGEYCLWQQSWMLGWFQELCPSSVEHTPLPQGTARVKVPKFRLVRMRLKRYIIARNWFELRLQELFLTAQGIQNDKISPLRVTPNTTDVDCDCSQGNVWGSENRTLTSSLGMWLNWFPVLIVFLGIQLFPQAFWVRMGPKS